MSYQSAAAVAATSPYDSTSTGKNRSTSARNFTGSDLSMVAHQPASSFRACCAARSWPPRRIATSAPDGIAHRPSSSLLRLLPFHERHQRPAISAPPILSNPLHLRIIKHRLQQYRILSNLVHIRRQLLHRIRLRRHRPELRISKPSRQPPRIRGRLRQPITHHHSKSRDVTHSRAQNKLVLICRINQHVMLSRANSLSTSGLIMNNAQRRRRNTSLTRKRHSNRTQHIRMRRHRRLLQLLQLRLIPVLVTSQRQQSILRQPELVRLRQAILERFLTHTKQRKLRSEEHTSELQSRGHLVCRLLLEKKNQRNDNSGIEAAYKWRPYLKMDEVILWGINV